MPFDDTARHNQPERLSREQFGEIADSVALEAQRRLGAPLSCDAYTTIWNAVARHLRVPEYRIDYWQDVA